MALLVTACGASTPPATTLDSRPPDFYEGARILLDVHLVDLIAELRGADARRAFLLRSHLGNYSLWMAGLFPDYLERRHRRRGAPSMSYFDRMGASGYSTAARSDEAEALGVRGVFERVGRDFVQVRFALNRVSERVLWPSGGDAVSRLIRGVERGGA